MSDTKVVTGKCRASYAHVFEAKAVNPGDDPKFSIALLIPKTDTKTIAKINAAIDAAKAQGKDTKFGGKIPPNCKIPLRDGDTERPDDENYAGMYFINANTKSRPEVVDVNRNPIMDKEDFYSGCYCRASVIFYPFNYNGTKGIAAGLGNLQKLADGEKLSGGSSAEEDFGDDSDDSLM